MSNKSLGIEKAREIFHEKGCTLLDNEYINSRTTMKFICSCGRECSKSIRNFHNAPYCKECVKERRPKNTGKRKKYTLKDVQKIFEEAGCMLLAKEYKNVQEKMPYICECGRESIIALSKFLHGRRCNECANERRGLVRLIPYEDMVKDFENSSYQVTTRKEEYKNASQKVGFICDVGHIGEMTYAGFRGGSRCIECAGHKRLSFEQVEAYFEENDCELLEDVYINAHTKMKYICSCGNVSEINYNNFSNGKRCDKCARVKRGIAQRVPFEAIKKLFEDNGSVLISTEYDGQNIPLLYICKCGREAFSSYATFKGSKQCKKCSFEAMRNNELTDSERIDRRHIEGYKTWVKNCYRRDKYTCQCCGVVGGKLNAHHKDGYHWCEERRLDDTNSVTLCEECHMTGDYAFHRLYGKKNNTEEQFNEWIKKYRIFILKERSA